MVSERMRILIRKFEPSSDVFFRDAWLPRIARKCPKLQPEPILVEFKDSFCSLPPRSAYIASLSGSERLAFQKLVLKTTSNNTTYLVLICDMTFTKTDAKQIETYVIHAKPVQNLWKMIWSLQTIM